MQYDLRLYEELMLLSLRDQKGTMEPMVSYRDTLAGAIMAELLLLNFIELDKSKKYNPVRVVKGTPTGDEILDECLEKIISTKTKKKLMAWIIKFSNLKNLKHRIARKLSHKGILTEDIDKVLLFFTRKIYPAIDPKPEQQIIERMRDAIFKDDNKIEPRTILLVSLAQATGLLKRIFDKEALKNRRKRIEQIISGEVVGTATKEAIEAVQAALVTAVIMPSVVATNVTR